VINLLVTGVSSVDQRLITGRNEKLTEKNTATNASSDTLPCFYRTMHIARNVQSQLACCPPPQKLLLRAYRKSYMRNRLVPKWMTLTFI